MIRSAEEVRRIIDGTEDRAPTKPRQRNYQRRDVENNGMGKINTPVMNHQETLASQSYPVCPPIKDYTKDQPIIRRGRTLGASSKVVPRSEESASTPPQLSEISGKDIDVVYRLTNPTKKIQSWKHDGFICVNTLTSVVSLKNANKVTVATCQIKEFNLDKFNEHEEMTIEKYDVQKS